MSSVLAILFIISIVGFLSYIFYYIHKSGEEFEKKFEEIINEENLYLNSLDEKSKAYYLSINHKSRSITELEKRIRKLEEKISLK